MLTKTMLVYKKQPKLTIDEKKLKKLGNEKIRRLKNKYITKQLNLCQNLKAPTYITRVMKKLLSN